MWCNSLEPVCSIQYALSQKKREDSKSDRSAEALWAGARCHLNAASCDSWHRRFSSQWLYRHRANGYQTWHRGHQTPNSARTEAAAPTKDALVQNKTRMYV
jgi:hypothetical protein